MESSTSVNAGYKKSEATKKRILNAAYKQFATYGFHGASLRDIATLCGISHPGIRHHFPTKEDLFIEVLRERDARVEALIKERIAERGMSIDVAIEITRHNMTTPGLVELFAATAAQAGNPKHPAHDYFVQRYEQIHAMYVEYLKLAKAQGQTRPDLDPDRAASLLMAVLDGLQIQWMLIPDKTKMDALFEESLRSIIE